MISLSNIFIYPIKGCAGISLDYAELNDRGIRYDRRWMLIDESNVFISQRTNTKMALIDLAIDGDYLFVSYEDRTHQIPLDRNYSESVEVTVWEDQVKGYLAAEKDHQWFSDILQMPVRLVAMQEDSHRRIKPKYAVADGNEVSFADGYPYMITGNEALRHLNSVLENEYLLIDRFRPNFVFDGGKAHEEDTWLDFSIGESRFAGVKPCARCQVITIDQQTGTKGKEPLKTLAGYRKIGNKILFGYNAILKTGTVVRKGDEIVIHERTDPPLPLPE